MEAFDVERTSANVVARSQFEESYDEAEEAEHAVANEPALPGETLFYPRYQFSPTAFINAWRHNGLRFSGAGPRRVFR